MWCAYDHCYNRQLFLIRFLGAKHVSENNTCRKFALRQQRTR